MPNTVRVGAASGYVEVTDEAGLKFRVPPVVLVDPANGNPYAASGGSGGSSAGIGDVTDAAGAADGTGNGSVIAWLKRLALQLVSGFKTPQNSLSVVPARGALANISGTITTGGTAQQIAAANANRLGWKVQNLSTADLWVSTLATAVQLQPSLRVPAGGLYESPAGAQGTGAISIVGATTGQAFAAREW